MINTIIASLKEHKEKFWLQLSKVLFATDVNMVRFILAIGELFWAIMLFWPGDTFSRPTYTVMAKLSPEIVWSFAFLFSGLMQLHIAIYQKGNTQLGQLFGIWNACLWLSATLAMLLSVYPPPAAIGGELALAFAATWVGVRPTIMLYLDHKCKEGRCHV